MTETYQYTLDAVHDYGVFWIFTAVSLTSLFFICVFLPETKAKSLEIIEKRFLKVNGQQE